MNVSRGTKRGLTQGSLYAGERLPEPEADRRLAIERSGPLEELTAVVLERPFGVLGSQLQQNDLILKRQRE